MLKFLLWLLLLAVCVAARGAWIDFISVDRGSIPAVLTTYAHGPSWPAYSPDRGGTESPAGGAREPSNASQPPSSTASTSTTRPSPCMILD